MTPIGFRLKRLTLMGAGVPNAEVQFGRGLNVISGPSDTGKTFIAQCIDYMFGASDSPKEIPEAASYESIQLALYEHSNELEYILERSLRGGDFRIQTSASEERILGSKHQADDENNISQFLLRHSGFTQKKVRTNQQGKTRPLSFRDLSRLILVDEESIISEQSPIHTGQYTSGTVESSVFRLLLSGVDDSAIVAMDDPKVVKGREEGKNEVLGDLLSRTQEQIAGLKVEGDAASLQLQLDRIESLFDKACATLSSEQEVADSIEKKRQKAWSDLRQIESRVNILSGLQQRFELLKEQYSSDLRRLETIAEAGVRLGQMKEERCPVCGALAEHHERAHQMPEAELNEVADSCCAEAAKIRNLLMDLKNTMAENEIEIERLRECELTSRRDLNDADNELSTHIQPQLRLALQKLRDGQSQRDLYRRALDLHERLQDVQALFNKSEKLKRNQATLDLSMGLSASALEDFSKEVENLLRDWYFPNLDRVTFSESDQDIVISGTRRASHGKGVRAITHAAFNLALLSYCRDRSMAHPGLVIIDSPLVVYREPDTNEKGFDRDVKDAFYRSLAKRFADDQIIIMENEDPPADLNQSASIIKFTGTDQGRRGFIPASIQLQNDSNVKK